MCPSCQKRVNCGLTNRLCIARLPAFRHLNAPVHATAHLGGLGRFAAPSNQERSTTHG